MVVSFWTFQRFDQLKQHKIFWRSQDSQQLKHISPSCKKHWKAYLILLQYNKWVRTVTTTRTTKNWCRKKNKKFTMLFRLSTAKIIYLWPKKIFQEWKSRAFTDLHDSCRPIQVTLNQYIFMSSLSSWNFLICISMFVSVYWSLCAVGIFIYIPHSKVFLVILRYWCSII